MRRVKWDISAGAVLLFALMYFFDGSGLVSAAIPAVLVHELGHVLFLRLQGKRLTRVRVALSGLTLDYAGNLRGMDALLCCGAGPLFGLAYAAATLSSQQRFFQLSGTVSLLLSLFNLLPVLPLDGGRIVAALAGPRTAQRLSRVLAALLLAAGAVLMAYCGAYALLFAGAWLTICSFRA